MDLETILKELESRLPSIIPGIEFQLLRYENLSGNEYFIQCFISHRNKTIANSSYFYTTKTIVHFTNYLSLNSILRGNSIRLYTLKNPDDPLEFSFAGKILHLNKKEIDYAKNNIFQISFCESDIFDDNKREFNMWRLYGYKGRGVAVEFSILNNPENWLDYHISKVSYGNEQINPLKMLLSVVKEYNKESEKVYVDLTKLLPFHKSDLFSIEKEVRLICDRRKKIVGSSSQVWYDYNLPNMPQIVDDLQKLVDYRGKVQYFEIPIYCPDTKDIIERPLLKVEKIIIGFNYTIKEINTLISGLKSSCNEFLGYMPQIQCTKLRKKYLGLSK